MRKRELDYMIFATKLPHTYRCTFRYSIPTISWTNVILITWFFATNLPYTYGCTFRLFYSHDFMRKRDLNYMIFCNEVTIYIWLHISVIWSWLHDLLQRSYHIHMTAHFGYLFPRFHNDLFVGLMEPDYTCWGSNPERTHSVSHW